MKRKILWTLFLVATLLVALAAWAPAVNSGDPQNPSLFEKRFQCNQIVAFFQVDLDIARQWVPPPFELMLDVEGKATGILAVMQSPVHSVYSTPNNPPMKNGENIAPESVAHFWFVLQGPVETIPVPGAAKTNPTAYYYDVADLVTNPVAHRLYRRAGRPAMLVSNITLVDNITTQTGEITFLNGSKITFAATAPAPFLSPIKLGGNAWQWHVGGLGEMGDDLGVRLDPDMGNPSNVSKTRVQFLALLPGKGGETKITIDADAGTCFEDVFGKTQVNSMGTFFTQNNVVLNASRGDLMWTTSPSPLIPVPPILP